VFFFAGSGGSVGRIPTCTKYSQGASGHHLGLRLMFPKYMSPEYVKTSLNMKPVSIETMNIAEAISRLQMINITNQAAGRPAFNPYIPVKPGAYAISRLGDACALMFSYCCMWFGAAEYYLSMTVGTNNLDPISTSAFTEPYWLVASMRQLQPVYNCETNSVVVPFPSVGDTSTALSGIASAFCLDFSIPGYGPGLLEYGSSTIPNGGTLVVWNGEFISDDRQAVKTADAQIQNMMPTSSPLAIWSPPIVSTALYSKVLSVNPLEDSVRKIKYKKKIAEILEKVGFKYQQNIDKKMSPRPTAAYDNEVGSIGEKEFGADYAIVDAMTPTILNYPSFDFPGANNQFNMIACRIIHGGVVSYESGDVASLPFIDDQIQTVFGFIKDPVSYQGSEITENLLGMSVVSFKDYDECNPKNKNKNNCYNKC